MNLKIKINPLAVSDAKEVKEYIREENINAINKFTQILIDSIENLAEFPELGMELSKKIEVKTDYRYLIVDEYIIFYKFDAKYLYVYRILSSKRDYMKILFEWIL